MARGSGREGSGGEAHGRGDKPRRNDDLQPTSALMLLAIAAVTGVTLFLLADIWLRSGRAPLLVPLLVFLIPLGVAVFIGWQAWLVRRYTSGKKTIDPLHAARIWVLTQAGSRAGAILAGLSLGLGCAYLNAGSSGFLTEQAIHAFLAGGASVVLTVVSWLSERWCIYDDDDAAPSSNAQAA